MSLLHIAGGATEDKLDASDVFSTYLYTGNGSTQTITNGIDLAGKGGLVWLKPRDDVTWHSLWDTNHPNGKLVSNMTNALVNTYGTTGVTQFNNNGFRLTGNNDGENLLGASVASWTFRKAPKFFDIVTYTGDGVAGRQIPHNLGCDVGMIVVKATSTVSSWYVWSRAFGDGKYLTLDSTNNLSGIECWGTHTSTYFKMGTYADGRINTSGRTYVAYLFAHDPSADGIIQCGSFTTDASGNATVNLGWEPQFILMKNSSNTGGWWMLDSVRGLNLTASNALQPNYSNAELTVGTTVTPTATGFNHAGLISNSSTAIYLAIRRPNKVPTSGTEVYNAIARTGTGAVATVTGVGFAPDLAIAIQRTRTGSTYSRWCDRLRGSFVYLIPELTSAEGAGASSPDFSAMNSVVLGGSADWNGIGYTYINHFFKRAKGFFDEVCYTGDSVDHRQLQHNLKVKPELLIHKDRNMGHIWYVHFSANGFETQLVLNRDLAHSAYGSNILTSSTSDYLDVRKNSGEINITGERYVAYLFATLANVSKCFSYTGNGSSLNVECGFSTGARFVLCKRTDSTGDWFLFDSTRGIVAGNDPHLSLNTTAAEVTTDDSIDPYSNGFTVNQNAATNLNVNGGTYIGLAIA